MNEHFWESTQKARQEHFCFFCGNYIQPGEIYRRWIWVPRRGHFHIMHEHYDPGCPPNWHDEFVREQMREERAARGEPVVFEAKVSNVIVRAVDGSTRVEQKTEFVPALLRRPVVEEYFDPNEEIPF